MVARIILLVPCSGLFFLTRCKFFRILQMGSLLRKIYSGLLAIHEEVRLWVAIAEIGTDAIMSMQMAYSLKPWIAKYFSLQLQPK